jgi:hypothetical protein
MLFSQSRAAFPPPTPRLATLSSSARLLRRSILVAQTLATTAAGAFGGDATTSESLAPTGTSAIVSAGSIWEHHCFDDGLTAKCVSIGNEGTLVFTDFEGVDTFARTLSSFDHTPSQAVTQTAPSSSRRQCVVRSADHGDVRTDFAYVKASLASPTVPVLTRASYTDSAHDWTYAFPFSVADTENSPLGLGVSRDGHTIVATVFKRAQWKQAIAVFADDSPTPTSYVEVPVSFEPLRYAVSSDGSALFVVSMSFCFVFDTHAGAMAYYADNFEYPTSGMAISGDGSRFAKSYISDHRIEVFQRQGASYSLYATYHPTGLGQCYRIAFSDDGNTLAAGYWDTIYPGQTATTIVLDLQSTVPQVAFEDHVTGSGPFWNLIQDVEISADGSTVAAGMTGSQSGSVPQLVVYHRDPATHVWSIALQAVLPGSALDVALSADGSKVAVASMRGHMEAPIGGGEIDLFRIADEDVAVNGVPHNGAHVNFHYSPATPLPAGTQVTLLAAPDLSIPAQVLPIVGTLYLDRFTAQTIATATVDASGGAALDVALPSGSTAIGGESYYQVLCASPGGLSQTWVKLTVLP